MSRSAEDVLLIVNQVKNKKCEGSLYMMSERMAFMQQSKNTFSVSHNYADIKTQKISPDTKDKVQLQVCMYDGGANTFHFNNAKGRKAQQQDREGIKELLQQLLPKFRRKVNSELEEKNRILQEDPKLFQLYKDLVVSGIVTADEFWANRVKASNTTSNGQDVGISAAFLAEVKPQTDGCNGLKYNLTADIIHSIFRTYPAVKQRHAEYVPDKLSEQEFWTRFFQSHYFHRDRITLGNDDMFAECAKADDKDTEQLLQKPVEDRFVDLTSISDGTASEGYGCSREEAPPSTASQVNASLIKRFNQHSTRVLQAGGDKTHTQQSQQSTSSSTTAGASSSAAGGDGVRLNGSAVVHEQLTPSASTASLCSVNESSNHSFPAADEPPPAKKVKIREKIMYEDLTTEVDGGDGPTLSMANLERYYQGPTTVTGLSYNTSEQVIEAFHATSREVMMWQPALPRALSATVAGTVLSELTPGGALMPGHNRQQLHQIPTEIESELTHLYNALQELLRHFWSCFPVTTKQLEEKVVRMRENLERFQITKLAAFKQKLHESHYSITISRHLEEMLQAAFNKFGAWQNRRMGKKS